MYMAHAGAALAAKRADRRVTATSCLTAAWIFDLTGVGHWIAVAVPLAGAAAWIGWRRWGRQAAVVLASTVLLHDVLDLVVGVQLWPRGPYLGADLSGRSWLEVAAELIVVVAGWALYRSTVPVPLRRRTLIPLAVMVVFALAHARTETSASTHHVGVAQGLVLVAGLVGSWAAILLVDRSVRSPADQK